ncbi:hypothetical protein PPL_05448 [Heterostelium album PN500]|uniref:Uncharacterized protein n=1 Tax=Heterostelium pallidum (strain ATCC 26659 / Pp 5 / PN500) TaxID=670386 RepID=D3BA73_HETP5|nr:hypothetical protein PPL_05448 [Heterostelium album PN500]EFA81460.1 hypothetical protein PPL_05448 [Heterostelium album PN500]|eukprot:XP_020433578.1 hypothetical protein PPL_05448 [Heterostelium album PN500]
MNNKNELNDRLFLCEIARSTKSISRRLDSPVLLEGFSNKTKKIMDLLIKLRKYYIIKHILMIKTLLEDLRVLLLINEKMSFELVSLHGHFLIVDILLDIKSLKSGADKDNGETTTIKREDKNIIDILSRLYAIINEVSSIPHIHEWIINNDELMNNLFHSLHAIEPLDSAIASINEILLYNQTQYVYDLRKIKNIYKLISELSSVRLFIFLKIISTCIYIPDPYDAPTIQQSIQLRNNINTLYNTNQSLVLNSPCLLEKLCILLRKSTENDWVSPSLRKGAGISTNQDDWNQLDRVTRISFTNDQLLQIIESLNLEMQMGDQEDPYQFLSDYSKSSYQSDLLLTLYGLANGPRKIQVLSALERFGFIKILHTIITTIDWTKSEFNEDNDALRVNPHYIKKIQLLRFVYLYFDVETIANLNGCLIISQHERNVINGLEQPKEGEIYWIQTLYDSFLKCGFIEKERTFLTCCIQSSFRVPNCNVAPYLAKQGLLNSLFRELLSGKTMFYQMNFDILGELLKNDRHLYRTLNQICIDEPESFSILRNIILLNIIDANVFIRAILLSHFNLKKNNLLDTNVDYVLFNFVYYEKRPEILEKEGHFDESLAILEEIDKKTHDFIDRTLELYSVWKDFYNLNSRDAFSIEFSSKFSFNEFNEIVEFLTVTYGNTNKTIQ